MLSEYIDLVEFYQNKICFCLEKKRPNFVFVVNKDYDEASDDEQDDNQLLSLKRSFERRISGLESFMNKKLFKSIQALATDTRTRLSNL